MNEYYEIKVHGRDSIFVYDTQELIYQIMELENGYGLRQNEDFEVITHSR